MKDRKEHQKVKKHWLRGEKIRRGEGKGVDFTLKKEDGGRGGHEANEKRSIGGGKLRNQNQRGKRVF